MALELPRGLTLYFSRHGETEANVARRFQGDNTDTALTPRGITQAEAIAKIVAREVAAPDELEFVASPLPRACKTMEIVRRGLGLPERGYETDIRLREIELGAWDGLTDDEARALDPQAFETRGNDKWNVRVPGGGENYCDVAMRVTSWIREMPRNSFVVSHGAATRILRGLFAGLSGQEMSALDEPQGVVFRAIGSKVERLDP
jgi:probable phosphoglycerate mutase